MRLPYRGPLDFRAALDELADRRIPGVEAVDGDCYRRTIVGHNFPGMIEVKDPGDGGHLEFVAHVPTWRLIIEDVAACRRLFDLDAELCERHEPCEQPADCSEAQTHSCARELGAWDGFETAVVQLLSAEPGHRVGSCLAGALARGLGTALPRLGVPRLTHVFPSAQRVASAGLDEVVGCGLPLEAAEAVVALASAASGASPRAI